MGPILKKGDKKHMKEERGVIEQEGKIELGMREHGRRVNIGIDK